MARKREREKEAPVREPRLVARFIGEQFSTLMLVGVVITLLSAWVIWDKLGQDDPLRRIVPVQNYFVLGFGLLLCAIAGLGRYLLAEEVEEVIRRRRQLKEAKVLLKEVKRGLRRGKGRVKPAVQEQLKQAEADLRAARDAKDWPRLGEALAALDRKLDDHLSFARKSQMREYAESIAGAVLIALFLRAFVVEAFKIPSGSMIPTLQVGDHIFVNKFIYGLRLPWPLDETDWGSRHQKFFMNIRKPKRGEVIVFKYPKEPEKDFIKRIVAVEGDSVEYHDTNLYVNGKLVERTPVPGSCEYDDFDEMDQKWKHRFCTAYREHFDGSDHSIYLNARDQPHAQEELMTGVARLPDGKVPPGSVFVMGDNRDNSHDSRYWGPVPFDLIKGKAMVIWWSSGEPEGIRLKRMGRLVE